MPCALARSRAERGSARSPMPCVRAGPAACRRLCAGRHLRSAPACPAAPGHARRSGLSYPVPSSPKADGPFGLTAIKVIDQQSLHLRLCRSLAWRWRISLARSSRIRCSSTGRLGRGKLALAVACSSRPRSASFLGGYTVNGRTDGKYHGTRHHLSLTTCRQRQCSRGKLAVFRPAYREYGHGGAVPPCSDRIVRMRRGRSRRGDSAIGWPSPQRMTAPGMSRTGSARGTPNLDSRGLGWMRLWGHADRPVLLSGAVPAFDREPGGS